jgi:hypothetical protein
MEPKWDFGWNEIDWGMQALCDGAVDAGESAAALWFGVAAF